MVTYLKCYVNKKRSEFSLIPYPKRWTKRKKGNFWEIFYLLESGLFLLPQVLGRCFLTVMQVHFQFLSQALQKVQPVAHSCFAEAVAQERKNVSGAGASNLSPTNELEDAIRSWRGAAEVRRSYCSDAIFSEMPVIFSET